MIQEPFDKLSASVQAFIRGKSDEVRLALVCLLAEGHLLIDDVPGVGKTSLARAISSSISGKTTRIQFTPDLLPTDVTGVQIFNSAEREFQFHEGPVFANVVVADEINRASPKTQSALLEVMEERQVTVDGETKYVPRPFMVVATQNPVEHDGTYFLPEAQLDRFMMRIAIGYPDHASQVDILKLRSSGGTVDDISPVLSLDDVKAMMAACERVSVADNLFEYVSRLATHSRSMAEVRLGVSPRGALALVQAAKVLAASTGMDFVTLDHIKALAPHVLSHRLLLAPEAELDGVSAAQLIATVLATVPVPSERTAV